MDKITIILAGYSHPYPYRKQTGSGDRLAYLSDKTTAKNNVTRQKSKLAWLYSNGGINQLKTTAYIPMEMEVFPYEHAEQAAHNTRDLENIRLPGGERSSSKVSDEVVCSILKKIWSDLHPVNERWQKMTFRPALKPITEIITREQPPRPKPGIPTDIAEIKRGSTKGRARKALQAIVKVFRRVSGAPGNKPRVALLH